VPYEMTTGFVVSALCRMKLPTTYAMPPSGN